MTTSATAKISKKEDDKDCLHEEDVDESTNADADNLHYPNVNANGNDDDENEMMMIPFSITKN